MPAAAAVSTRIAFVGACTIVALGVVAQAQRAIHHLQAIAMTCGIQWACHQRRQGEGQADEESTAPQDDSCGRDMPRPRRDAAGRPATATTTLHPPVLAPTTPAYTAHQHPPP